jgi:PAS domain S-box-containing protein
MRKFLGMNKSPIRRHVFLPVVAGLLILTAIITISFTWYQSQHIEHTVSDCMTTVMRAFHNQLESEADTLTALVDFLQKDPSLQEAFEAGDRDKLLKVASPIFEELRAQHRVTHFYFTDQKRVCFLRVHRPSRHGDVINRYIILSSARTGRLSRGIELGQLGTFTLRVVRPWKVGNRLIGYLELGEEIDHILPRIKNLVGADLIVTVDKAYLDKAKWEEGMRVLKRESSWDRFAKFVVIDSTMPKMSQSVESMLRLPHSEHNGQILSATINDRPYRGELLPLIDVAGRDVGDLTALVDVSRDSAALKKALFVVVAATLAVFGLTSWLFWTYLGRLEQSLATAMDELRLARDIAEQTAVRLGKLSRAVEQSPAGVLIANIQGFVEYGNVGISRMTGYDADELVGKQIGIFKNVAHSDEFYGHIREVLLRGDIWRGELCIEKQSGQAMWCNTTIAPIFDKHGAVAHFVAVEIDITDKKQAAEELLEYAGSLAKASAEIKKQAKNLAVSEHKYRTLFDSSRDAIMILTPKEGFLDGNAATVELFGCKDSREFVTYSPSDLSPERQPDGSLSSDKSQRMMSLALKNGSHFFEWTHKRCDGSEFPATVLLTRMELEGKAFLQATVRDMTEEKRTAETLRLAKEDAEAANIAKSNFLASMSHELRTPLHGVVGMTELLKGTALEERQRQFVDACNTSGRSLLELINDVLDFSKIEAGKLELDERDFQLGWVVLETIETLRFDAQQKGLSLVSDFAPQANRWVRGDAVRLRQVLVNLIGNAVKFTDAGQITVKVEPAKPEEGEHAIRFTVTDTGIGIPADRVDRLFQSFSQGDSSIARKYGGTGLGLAISKRLIELMGGQIGVTSQLGQGSVFWFIVSLQPATVKSQARANPIEADQKRERQLGALLTGRRVLLVEDNQVNRMYAQEVLQQAGMTCCPVKGGLDAIEAMRSEPFDVVLMDCQMPEMDGFKTTQRIREMEQGGLLAGRTPIIALTANAIKGDRERCLEAGMDDYIAKPFGSLELLERISRQLLPRSADASKTHENMWAVPATDSDNMKPLDYKSLLRRCRGNVEFVQSLLSDFEADLPKRVDEIADDVSREDAAAVLESAHALKGAAATMSADPIRAIAAEIEAAGKSGELRDASVAADRLRNEAQRCLQFIPELRESIHASLATADEKGTNP